MIERLEIYSAWKRAFSKPDRRPIEDWASENITLPPMLAKSGKFSVAGSRHFIDPLRAMHSDRVRGVRICAPVRGGKTLIADVSVPWGIANDNASVLWIFQSKPVADDHAEERQMPILESVGSIRSILPSNRHKKRKADILFSTGLPLKLQGPALGGLQSKGFKWVVLDEPWLYEPGIITEAKARMGDFEKIAANKFLAISQGGEEDGDWDMEFRSGHLYTRHVFCAGCGAHFAPEWTMQDESGKIAGVAYESVKFSDGRYDKDASSRDVRFVCPKCGHSHPDTEETRAEWNEKGKYFDEAGVEFNAETCPSEVSFRWHALIDTPWTMLVRIWLDAQEAKHVGNFAPLVAFFQKRCALMRSDRTIHDTELPFARKKYDVTGDVNEKLWPGEEARFMTCDRQGEDLYWVVIRAWSSLGETRRIWFGRLYGESAIKAKQDEFGVRPNCVIVDSGYKPKGDHGVYAACIRYGWIAGKGDEAPFFWHTERMDDGRRERVQKPWAELSYGDPGEGTANEGRTRAPLIRFSSPTMADRVHGLINRGLWVEPECDEVDEMEREYRKQMAAEFKRPKLDRRTGKKVDVWTCPSGNNHAFDDSKMQVLMAMLAGLLPSGVELDAQTKTNAEVSRGT